MMYQKCRHGKKNIENHSSYMDIIRLEKIRFYFFTYGRQTSHFNVQRYRNVFTKAISPKREKTTA